MYGNPNMSRIGRKNIEIPAGVALTLDKQMIHIKGPKGELSLNVPHSINVIVDQNQVSVKRANNLGQTTAYHGLIRSLLQNMIIGVSAGFEKKLQLVGTGYRARMQGKNLILNVGYSNPVEYSVPEGIQIQLDGDTVVKISGIDHQQVGQVAAEIRKVRPPEPYKGKGIRYEDEVIRKKAGKATKSGAA